MTGKPRKSRKRAQTDSLALRHAEFSDIDHLAFLERCENVVQDQEFEVEVLWPWAKSAKDLVRYLKRMEGKDSEKKKGVSPPCRLYMLTNSPQDEETPLTIWGGCCVELTENAYSVVWLVIAKTAPPTLFLELVRVLKQKLEKSPERHLLIFLLPDRDELGMRERLTVLKGEGFTIKLARDAFSPHDGWHAQWLCPD